MSVAEYYTSKWEWFTGAIRLSSSWREMGKIHDLLERNLTRHVPHSSRFVDAESERESEFRIQMSWSAIRMVHEDWAANDIISTRDQSELSPLYYTVLVPPQYNLFGINSSAAITTSPVMSVSEQNIIASRSQPAPTSYPSSNLLLDRTVTEEDLPRGSISQLQERR